MRGGDKMTKITIAILLGTILLWNAGALAQEEKYEAACAAECRALTKDCTAYIECKVAKSQCLESCMQRKVLENVAVVLEKLTAVLEIQAKEKEEKEKDLRPFTVFPMQQEAAQNTTESNSTSMRSGE
jgi:hypothetical protein